MQTATGKAYYIGHVSPALLQHPKLTYQAKVVAVALLMHYNRNSGLCYVTQSVIAAELRMRRDAVIRCLKELKDQGLVDWQERKAPRGRAKGRANLYTLAGLFALCLEPIQAARDVGVSDSEQAEIAVSHSVLREVSESVPHASGFRAIEQNQSRIDSKSLSITSVREPEALASLATFEDGMELQTVSETGEVSDSVPHSSRIEQKTAGAAHSAGNGLTAEQVREQYVAPDGTSYYDGNVHDGWAEANAAIRRAGGEPFNDGALSKLIDDAGDDGDALVWFHAKWFLRRLASRKTPPAKPAPYFAKCVREDYAVRPSWPEFSRYAHGSFTDEQREALPKHRASAKEWVCWMNSFDGSLDDLPANARRSVNDAVKHGDQEVLDVLLPDLRAA